MQQFTAREGASYRTKLMAQPQAEAFARCLAANPRFAAVDVRESARAKNPTARHYVTFAPATLARRQDLLRHQQQSRSERAHAQAALYLVVRDPAGFYWVVNLASGSTHHTVLGRECDCGDATYRCNGTAVLCKHDEIIRIKHRAGEIETMPETPSTYGTRCAA